MRGTALLLKEKMVRKAVAFLRVDLVCLIFSSEADFFANKNAFKKVFLVCISLPPTECERPRVGIPGA
ncbi:hypothetical protein [Bartonella harrusi]|uniref:Uncharacterized protein n=1 Tax=Bartonella harrusi TaxID=2961895 RepID=A0ABY5EWG4_9HYPH|nr:hypothetical protein [Bartonella harrusi]UTO28238.1 hypothetical protein NMK50_08835 [Bartonella harrusi]